MNIFYENQEIEEERLELADKSASYFLGPDLTLRRCTLVLRLSARALHILPTRLIDCTIEVKQELSNKSWTCAALKNSRFTGRMSGCDFGPWRDYTRDWEYGAVEDCDFSEARLDACRFHGCDPGALRLPRWPCFTIVDPIGRADELSRLSWPGLFGSVAVQNMKTEPSSTVALTYHAPSVAKRLETTPEELRAILDTLDGIIL